MFFSSVQCQYEEGKKRRKPNYSSVDLSEVEWEDRDDVVSDLFSSLIGESSIDLRLSQELARRPPAGWLPEGFGDNGPFYHTWSFISLLRVRPVQTDHHPTFQFTKTIFWQTLVPSATSSPSNWWACRLQGSLPGQLEALPSCKSGTYKRSSQASRQPEFTYQDLMGTALVFEEQSKALQAYFLLSHWPPISCASQTFCLLYFAAVSTPCSFPPQIQPPSLYQKVFLCL